MMEKSGLVYEFSCPCNEKYIGETRRSLGVRSKEHAMSHFYLSWPMTDKNSAIFNHIRSCPKFLEKFDEYWSEPNTKYSDLSHNKRMGLFTPKFFTILKSNLSNESDRKITEAILIKLFNPSLNVKHATDGSHRKPWNLTLPIWDGATFWPYRRSISKMPLANFLLSVLISLLSR
jgi:hypothetical protein